MRRNLFGLLLFCVLLTSGCATCMVRDFPAGEPTGAVPRVGESIYPATVMDSFMVVSGGGIFQTGDCGNAPILARVIGWTVVVPLFLIDVPFSLAVDTLYVPADIRWRKIYRERKSREFSLSVGEASTNAPSVILVSASPYPYSEAHATFRLVESNEVVDVKSGQILRCPNPPSVYTLLYVSSDTYVELRREK